MRSIKVILGVILTLLGLGWIGQGTGLLPGSMMSGNPMWAIIGLVILVAAIWLVWSALRGNPTGTRGSARKN